MALNNWTLLPRASANLDNLLYLQYLEEHRGPKEGFSVGNSVASKTYIVGWPVRSAFLDDLLGYSYLSGTTLKRVIPEQHPDYPVFFASDATVEPMGKSSVGLDGVSNWTAAIINCNFRPAEYAIVKDENTASELDRYVIRTYEPNAEFISLQGGLRFVTPLPGKPEGQVVSSPPGKLIFGMGLNYLWKEVPSKTATPFFLPNFSNIRSAIGKVNSVDFDGYDPGTVLFLGTESKQIVPKLGQDIYHWDISYKMVYKRNGNGVAGDSQKAGHNYLYNLTQSPPIWDLVTNDGLVTGSRIYEAIDLNILFQIPA